MSSLTGSSASPGIVGRQLGEARVVYPTFRKDDESQDQDPGQSQARQAQGQGRGDGDTQEASGGSSGDERPKATMARSAGAFDWATWMQRPGERRVRNIPDHSIRSTRPLRESHRFDRSNSRGGTSCDPPAPGRFSRSFRDTGLRYPCCMHCKGIRSVRDSAVHSMGGHSAHRNRPSRMAIGNGSRRSIRGGIAQSGGHPWTRQTSPKSPHRIPDNVLWDEVADEQETLSPIE